MNMSFDPQILYEDSYLLCINKPAGLLSIRDGYDLSLPFVTKLLEPSFGKLWVVHRLDRDTSGAFVLARLPEIHRALNTAFEGRQVHKIYHAIVKGRPAWDEYLADLPLKIDGDRRHRTIVHPAEGKPAQTEFKVINSNNEFSLIEAHPLSGYTHQIRAHLLALGFPILADPLYASPGQHPHKSSLAPPPINRLALHAFQLDFQHPVTGRELQITALYPDDFRQVLISLSLSPVL